MNKTNNKFEIGDHVLVSPDINEIRVNTFTRGSIPCEDLSDIAGKTLRFERYYDDNLCRLSGCRVRNRNVSSFLIPLKAISRTQPAWVDNKLSDQLEALDKIQMKLKIAALYSLTEQFGLNDARKHIAKITKKVDPMYQSLVTLTKNTVQS